MISTIFQADCYYFHPCGGINSLRRKLLVVSGVNISEEVLTYSVDYFPNRAALVQAQLSQQFTDA